MFAICSRQEFVDVVPKNALRVVSYADRGEQKGAKRANSRMRPPRQLLPENRNGWYHGLSRPERSRQRRGRRCRAVKTGFTPPSGSNALKKLEAAKRAVSLGPKDQRLARAETKPAVSLGLRFVSPRLRSASLRFALGAPRVAREARVRVRAARRALSTPAPSARRRRRRWSSCRRAPGGSRAGLRACRRRSTPACASSSWRRRGWDGPRAHGRRGFRCG